MTSLRMTYKRMKQRTLGTERLYCVRDTMRDTQSSKDYCGRGRVGEVKLS